MTYAFQTVAPAGEVFAVAFNEDGTVYGVCGALHHSERIESELPNYDYNTEDAEWMQAQIEAGNASAYQGE